MATQTVLLTILLTTTALVPLASAFGASGDADQEAAYVVGFHEFPAELRAGGRYADEDVRAVDEALRFAVVHAKSARGFEERARHDPNVRYLQQEVYAEVDATANDPYYAQQYGLARINAPAAWDVTRGATSVTVAVVDTGIDRAHPDLAGGRVLAGYDFMNNDADPNDDCGHGTGVAGVVGANANNGVGVAGVAQVSIMPLKALGMNADGKCYGPFSAVASSIRYAVDNGARVISMSLGCMGCYDQATHDAIEYAYSRGALLVGSAGNNGPCTNCVSWPAAHPKVIAVAATDSANAQAYFSSTGPEVEVAAPGKSVYTTYRNGAYGLMSGTSLAAPHVSGVLALALSANPSYANTDLRAKLQQTAQDLGAAGVDTVFGHGLVNAGALLASAPAPAPAPAPNAPPVASFTATANGLSVSVTANASSDSDGRIVDFRWTWGDGIGFSSGDCPWSGHAYASGGTYTITLTVTDDKGATASTTRTVTVTAPAPEPAPAPTPAPEPKLHVGDIASSVSVKGKTERLTWTVLVVGADGTRASGATVSATIGSTSYTATTSADGLATFRLDVPKRAGVTYTLCVSAVELPGWTYDPSANVATCRSATTL